jgi:hypothetical protein
LPNNLLSSPPHFLLLPHESHPLSQDATVSQPQAGAAPKPQEEASQPQAGSQPESQHEDFFFSLPSNPDKSPCFLLLPQAESQPPEIVSQPQAGASQPHVASTIPQPLSHPPLSHPQAGASQPQVGSADPQGDSQPQAGSVSHPHEAGAQPESQPESQQEEPPQPFINFWSKSIP